MLSLVKACKSGLLTGLTAFGILIFPHSGLLFQPVSRVSYRNLVLHSVRHVFQVWHQHQSRMMVIHHANKIKRLARFTRLVTNALLT